MTAGYESGFLRALLTQRSPEKHLSIWLRDARGRTRTIDVAFEDRPEALEGGRARRDQFLMNFRRLLTELESRDAFFFDAAGARGAGV